MKKFKILEHKADLRIRVYGKDKEELFLNALLGMTAGLRPEISNQQSVIRKIDIKSPDSEALLVDFLSEALYLIQTSKEIYNSVKFKKLSDANLEAELTGQKAERFGEDIKAVTYHGLEIKERKDGALEATLIFDI